MEQDGEKHGRMRKVVLSVVVESDEEEARVVSTEVFSSALEARRYLRVARRERPKGRFLVLRNALMVPEDEPMGLGRLLWVVMLCDGATPRKLSVFLHELHAAHHEIPLRQKHVTKFTGKISVAAWPCELDRAIVPPGLEDE